MPVALSDTLAVVAKTLRQAAFWTDESRVFLDTATAVERAEAESLVWVCPVCDEVECDESCPLAEIRAKLI